MPTRTGTNKGVAKLRGSKKEFLRHTLTVKGAAANFSQADDQETTVVTHADFPGKNECVWRLQSSQVSNGTKLVATVDGGDPISGYSRVATQLPIPVYTIALLFVTAVGYTLNVDRCSSNGSVIDNIANVTYTGGQPSDNPATEIISLDLGKHETA